MSTNIANFKANMVGGGARPNHFRVNLTFPAFVQLGALAGQQGQFLCKSTSIPTGNISDIPLMFRGRTVHFAGERTFEPWSVTIINDTTFTLKKAIESWQEGIQFAGATGGRTAPESYQTDLTVDQLDRNGARIKTYKFIDAYPITMGEISLSYDEATAIEEFPVTFEYNYWVSETSQNAGQFGVNVSVDTPAGNFPVNT